jgi:predicted nucleic acid-binding protein
MLASVPLFVEYEAVLKRPEQLAQGMRSVAREDAFLDALVLRVEPVHLYYLWRPQLRDAADEMVLETALNGRADVLVTFNGGDFDAAQKIRTAGAYAGRVFETVKPRGYVMSNYALRVPESLFAYARLVAAEEKVSMNQFFVTAIAEKVSALKTESYFKERAARGDLAGFDAWLAASPDVPPTPGDELV